MPNSPEIFDPSTLDESAKKTPPEHEAARVVKSGKAKVHKKSAAEAAASSFFASTAKEVGEYLLWDVLLPAAKDGLYALINGGVSMMLFGEERGGKRSGRNRNYTSYNSMYDEQDTRVVNRKRPSGRGREPLIIDSLSKEEAYDLQEAILDEFNCYDCVDVKYVYQAAGIQDTDWTDGQWGWISLRGMTVEHTRYGWQLRLPAPIRLDR